MTRIKFDYEKVGTLIRDLKHISSEIESNMGKISASSYGKEINLSDSRLKVYDYRDKNIDIVQDDGTTVQETVREKYLKNDYVANARAYNQHVRNLYKKSSSAQTKETQSIESVINSLNSIESLISDFEDEQSVRFSNYLDDVGLYDFNFLSAYGPMGMPDNYSPSLGAIVTDEAYTSDYLGILGERPTSINLDKLPIFDGMMDIARNGELSYQEKVEQVRNLLMDNSLNADLEEVETRAKNALENVAEFIGSSTEKITDNLRIETLVNAGVPVIERLESSNLSTNIESVDGIFASSLVATTDLVKKGMEETNSFFQNMDLNRDGQKDLDFDGDGYIELHEDREALKDQLGIKTDVELDKDGGRKEFSMASKDNNGEGGVGHKKIGDQWGSIKKEAHSNLSNAIDKAKSAVTEAVRDVNKRIDNGDRIFGKIDNGPKIDVEQNKSLISDKISKIDTESIMKDVIENKENSISKILEDKKLTSEDMAINKEIQTTKITTDYKEPVIDKVSNSGIEDIKLDDGVDKKAVGAIAGAAGLGSLTNVAKPISAASAPSVPQVSSMAPSVPQVNGMAAGEILGINNNSSSTNMSAILGDTTSSSASPTTVVSSGTKPITSSNVNSSSSSTASQGSISNNSSSSKSSSVSTTGGSGSTLEDKDSGTGENSYGKPNKPSENADATKKGMLGDASIAELDAQDEKQIKIATGVTVGTVLVSGVLALANVLPWIMLILALVAILIYVGCRVKKKKDKEKRRAALVVNNTPEVVNAPITLENVQNVNESVETKVEETSPATVVTENVVPTQNVERPFGEGEFSSQPYEPSRDGITEIATSNNTKTE